ncbi:hypothetical protein E2562_003227 [Oryza meyeriana var. granulata]|uniref:Histone deacetylase interacting domain-containing protein n=1 Tax=Oryza meyeriana var. granulata TaxID=110450 RepID=A0A6G1EUY1_9ORYZ|nr:hypothetical protein E2562_003227 [Oryza meyeriana var. granulata]
MAQPPPSDDAHTVAAVSFLKNVRIRFQARLAVYEELCAVLKDYSDDPAAPAAPVVHRTMALLHGHPDLIAELNKIIHPLNRIELPTGDDDDQQGARPLRKRNGQVLKAEQLLADAKIVGGDKLHNRVLAVIDAVHDDKGLDAHQVYARFKELLAPDAPGHLYLLRGIADFLPKPNDLLPPHAAEGDPDADHRPSSFKRKRAAPNAAAADAVDINQNGDSLRPSWAKDKLVRAVAVVELHVNQNGDSLRPNRDKKKPCAADSQNALDDNDGDGDAVLPSSAKKPRSADNKIKRHPLNDGEESDTCWHVTTEDPHAVAATFRKMLEFHAWYSKLVTTMRRAEQLEREPHPHGALQDLFPSRECHEILEELYGGGWRTMQVTLDDGGRRADQMTLAAMLLLLRQKEDAAVKLAKRRGTKTRYGEPAAVSPAVIRARVRARRHQA